MRRPGTSFEYKGITLHVMEAHPSDGCLGCYGYTNIRRDCKALSNDPNSDETLCGSPRQGVVFVQDVEMFKAACVAHVLSE